MPRRALRRLARLSAWAAAAVAGLGLAGVLGFTLYAVASLPPLQPWHTEELEAEFSAGRDAGLDFAGYLQLEDRLFGELARTVAGWQRSDEAWLHSRFNPASVVNRLVEGAGCNRSFRLSVPAPRGSALLLHGLTDSPHSMEAMARSLHARGFEVTVLRLPGHGTLPSMMTEMSLADWQAAVRLAARDVAGRTPAGQPFYLGGYSTGATLALLHTLDTLQDSTLRRPDRLLLMAPAIELTPVIAMAEVIDLLGGLPITALEKVRWQEIVAEYDPCKFNSFPVNASRQVNRAARALRSGLAQAAKGGRLAALPPVLTWQSVVDSTVGSAGTVNTLYAQLPGAAHRLVLFDVNRHPALASVQRPAARATFERLRGSRPGHTLDLVGTTEADTPGATVSVQRLAPDGTQSIRATPWAWPAAVVSLGHVALPFPPDDVVYGFLPGSGRAGIPSIGSWLMRGESGALTIGLGALTRLRSNPFWGLVDEDLGQVVEADLADLAARPR